MNTLMIDKTGNALLIIPLQTAYTGVHSKAVGHSWLEKKLTYQKEE